MDSSVVDGTTLSFGGLPSNQIAAEDISESIFGCIHSRVHPLTLTSNSPQTVSRCSP